MRLHRWLGKLFGRFPQRVSHPRSPRRQRLLLDELESRDLPSAVFNEFAVPGSTPLAITSGPDHNLWIAEGASNKIGRLTPAGILTEFAVPTPASDPDGITPGPDGNLWFTEYNGNNIGQITPGGTITEFPVPTANSQPARIAAGPDGNLWFTEYNANQIGQITPTGTITEFAVPTPNSLPVGITAGPDGNVWFAEEGASQIGRITPAGTIHESGLFLHGTGPFDVTSGPDGNIWFTEVSGNKIGRLAANGLTLSQFPLPHANSDPEGITVGPDGSLWFTELNINSIGRITTRGMINEVVVPTASSGPTGITSGSDNNLWITEFNSGKVARLVPSTAAPDFIALDTLTGSSNGANPRATLVADNNGNLFGTTEAGGDSNNGTIFEVKAGFGTITTRAYFESSNGAAPLGQLAIDSGGNVYGATARGGAANAGTVFELQADSGNLITLASFDGTDQGGSPEGGVVLDSNGKIFGTTSTGGSASDGTFFELAQGSSTIVTLDNFNGTNGAFPHTGLLLDGAGDFFGTTDAGGMYGDGTVFEVVPNTATITRLVSFDGSDGANPSGGLVRDSSGNLYGTTYFGGPGWTGPDSGYGMVFEVPQGKRTIVSLASFNNSNGAYPQGDLLLDSSGNLFGTTSSVAGAGGGTAFGTVFELPAGTPTIDPLHEFDNYSLGANPWAGLIEDSSGYLIGTTYGGGPAGDGVLFEIPEPPSFTTFVLNSWTANGSGYVQPFETVGGTGTITFTLASGNLPPGLILSSTGQIYGTPTMAGTYSFEIQATDGGGASILRNFTITINQPVSISGATLPTWTSSLPGYNQTISASGGTGSLTYSAAGFLPPGLSLSSVGVLAGTPLWEPFNPGILFFNVTATDSVGASATALFQVTINPSVSLGIVTLVTFNGTNGSNPNDSLIEDGKGNLFGTTKYGGASLEGTAFELQPGTDVLTNLATFDGTNGQVPGSGVIEDSNGNFFGTTFNGGTANDGTVFEIQRGTDNPITLASFNGANGQQPAYLVEDSAGDLFGATDGGGAANVGTVFELQQGSNSITTLASFDGSNGAYPNYGVTMDASGNLFGTTFQGGAYGFGTVFEIQQGSGIISTLASFDGTNGSAPQGGLILDNKGNLFGTTGYGGPGSTGLFDGFGTVFELQQGSGTITTLAVFNNANGADPVSGTLVEDGSGNFFGTTRDGGDSGVGTVFEVPAGSGTIKKIDSFNGINGTNPVAGLVEDASGNFYATTFRGPGDGAVIEVVATLPEGTAGTPYNQTITATGGTGALSYTLSNGNLPPGLVFGGGVLSGTPTTAGNYSFTITATDTVAATDSHTYTISVTPGFLSQYLVTTAGPSTVEAGASVGVTVQAADQYGNPVTNYQGPASVTANVAPGHGASAMPGTVTISASGQGFFLANLQQVGSYTISVADGTGTYTGSASPVTVTPGLAAGLMFVVQPVDTPTGVTLPAVTVAIVDAYGNLETGDNTDAVNLSVGSGPGMLLAASTTTITVTGGLAAFNNLKLVVPGSYTLSAMVSGHFHAASNVFRILPLQVVVGSFAGTPSGFSLQFNAPLLVNTVTPVLYGQGFGATAPVPSATLLQIKDGAGNPITPTAVEGSVVLNTATSQLTFLATDTALEATGGMPVMPDGTYKAVLRSSAASDGFQALTSGGGFLDGLGVGIPGSGDYTQTFVVSVAAAHDDVLWVPDTADGPGQVLNAPGKNQVGSGFPVYLASVGGVTSVSAIFNYNPALLTVTGVTGTGFSLLPTSTPGSSVLAYSGPALPSGSQTPIGFLTASVPSGTSSKPIPYRARDLLHLASVLINGSSSNVATSDGLHLLAYEGDADGNGAYSANDAVLITRALLSTDTGFAAYPLVDPVIVADTDGAGFIPADAALQVNEAGVGLPTANLPIPPIPPGVHFLSIAEHVAQMPIVNRTFHAAIAMVHGNRSLAQAHNVVDTFGFDLLADSLVDSPLNRRIGRKVSR